MSLRVRMCPTAHDFARQGTYQSVG